MLFSTIIPGDTYFYPNAPKIVLHQPKTCNSQSVNIFMAPIAFFNIIFLALGRVELILHKSRTLRKETNGEGKSGIKSANLKLKNW